MTASRLEGRRVEAVVSDPWEFVTEHGSGPFGATVVRVGPNSWKSESEALLVRLDGPLAFQGVPCEYFVASPRHATATIASLGSGAEVSCGLTRVSAEAANSPDPFDLSRWRGVVALLATLRTA